MIHIIEPELDYRSDVKGRASPERAKCDEPKQIALDRTLTATMRLLAAFVNYDKAAIN